MCLMLIALPPIPHLRTVMGLSLLYRHQLVLDVIEDHFYSEDKGCNSFVTEGIQGGNVSPFP